MATITYIIGIIGGIILVIGAAWPDAPSKPRETGIKSILAVLHPHPSFKPYKSVKNWLLAIGGGVILLIYSILNYVNGGTIFFVFLQLLISTSSILMMMGTGNRINIAVIGLSGAALLAWSLSLFQGINTIIFIFGLIGTGMGYTLPSGTWYRQLALCAGSIVIASFSLLESNWIYFVLNVFFAIFAGYYMVRELRKRQLRT